MQSTAGDVAIFSDSMVKLTVDVIGRIVHPLTSIAVEFQIPGGDWETNRYVHRMKLCLPPPWLARPSDRSTLPVPDLAGLTQ